MANAQWIVDDFAAALAQLGDADNARNKLGWVPKISFDDLMKKHGYKAMDYHE